eukprot:1193909-Prorocentrum_minimum.AAC.4
MIAWFKLQEAALRGASERRRPRAARPLWSQVGATTFSPPNSDPIFDGVTPYWWRFGGWMLQGYRPCLPYWWRFGGWMLQGYRPCLPCYSMLAWILAFVVKPECRDCVLRVWGWTACVC